MRAIAMIRQINLNRLAAMTIRFACYDYHFLSAAHSNKRIFLPNQWLLTGLKL